MSYSRVRSVLRRRLSCMFVQSRSFLNLRHTSRTDVNSFVCTCMLSHDIRRLTELESYQGFVQSLVWNKSAKPPTADNRQEKPHIMEQTTPRKGEKPSTPVLNQHASVENTWSIPLSTVIATYPNDILLRYVVAPLAMNTLR